MPPDEHAALAGIVTRLRLGGAARRQAIADLYARYSRRLLAHFLGNKVDRAQAQELVQDVFVNVIRAIEGYRGEAPLGAWIWTIARNTLIDAQRKWKPQVSLDDEEAGEALLADPALQVGPEHGEGLEDCVQRGFAAYAERYPERAQTLTLAVVEGWTMREVAQYLSRTEGATREYLYQCRNLLRPFIEPCREYSAGA